MSSPAQLIEAATDDPIARLKAVAYMEQAGISDSAFSCGRCKFFQDGFCHHKAIQAPVDGDEGCCNEFYPAGDPPKDESEWAAAKER